MRLLARCCRSEAGYGPRFFRVAGVAHAVAASVTLLPPCDVCVPNHQHIPRDKRCDTNSEQGDVLKGDGPGERTVFGPGGSQGRCQRQRSLSNLPLGLHGDWSDELERCPFF